MAPTLSPTSIHQGPGRLWLYVPAPAHGNRLVVGTDGSPTQPSGLGSWAATTAYMAGQMIKDANNNTELCLAAGTSGSSAPSWLTSAGPAISDGGAAWLFVGPYGAYFAGATEGAITSTLTPKYQEIGADQVASPIDVVMTADAYEIDVTIKQSNLANLISFFAPGTFSTGTDANQPSGAQAYEQITFGGIIPVLKLGVAIISPRRDTTGKFAVSHLYQAYQAEAVKLPFQRGKETTFGVKFKGVADSSRPAGDQVGMVWRQV